MARPRYETANDRLNEQGFASLIADRFGAAVHKLPVSYAVDYLVLPRRGGRVWVEYKRRRHTYGTYPDVVLSALKWWHGTSLATQTGAKFVFVVQWDDSIGYVQYDPQQPWIPELKWGGRTKATRDLADVEPVFHLPIKRFVKLQGA